MHMLSAVLPLGVTRVVCLAVAQKPRLLGRRDTSTASGPILITS